MKMERPKLGTVASIASVMFLAAHPAHALPGDTVHVPVTSEDTDVTGYAWSPSISGDGRYVAFKFIADVELAPSVGQWVELVIHDRATGRTTRIDPAAGGVDGEPGSPLISGNARFVTFTSSLDITPEGIHGDDDVFLYDRGTTEITRLSVDAEGREASGNSWAGSISGDGRFVAFMSDANNLVPGDDNDLVDVFVHDTRSNATTRISAVGEVPQGWTGPSISTDGRHIAFTSPASNLVPGDTNQADDVFLHDTVTGAPSLVSIGSGGQPGDGSSWATSISADGGTIVFLSEATNLVEGDNNGAVDVFVRDVRLGATKRISTNSEGGQGDDDSHGGAISADGRYVAFASSSTNLVPDDTNGTEDVFVHHLASGRTERVSIFSNGDQADGPSSWPAITYDARFIAFGSGATNPTGGENQQSIFVHEQALGWFVDDEGSVFEADIDGIAAAGITRGCNPPDNDRYCPDQVVTRDQMAAFLVRAIGLPAVAHQELADTEASVFAADIDALYAAGITRGCNPPDNDRYCPHDPVTRGQMAAFLVRAFVP